jgi:zinc protease
MKRVFTTIIITIAISALCLNTFAQKNMNEDFRKSAPAPLAPTAFEIPKPFETVLPNGLKVVVFEDTRLPLVSYRLAFKSGEILDPKDSIGLTAALVAMLNEGTKSRTSKQLAEEIERLGANISVSSSEDNTIISGSTLTMYGKEVLDLMADVLLNPIFPEKEFSLYKKNTLENLKYQRSQPSFLADEQMSKILYGDHPYSVVSPSAADIERLKRANLSALREKVLVPNNATLIVVGNVNRASLLKQVKEQFGSWKKGTIASEKFAAPPIRSETTITVVDRPGSIQSNIVIANLAIDRSNPDFFAVLVMNQILGAGASSRLFMNLREAKGYTYGAYSQFETKRLAGNFRATAEVRTPVTGDSLKEFFYELNRIRSEKASEKELKDAKSYLSGVFPLRAETQEGMINLLVSQQLYDLPSDYLQTYRDKVNAVTLAEVERVANKYIAADKLAIVIVGDADEILPQIKSYSKKIEVFDADGVKQDVANYGKSSSGETANVAGKWDLNLEAQGQKLPVSLELTQDGAKVSGTLNSMLGKGEISDAKVTGNKLKGTAKSEMQGKAMELSISGTVDGDSMKGTIETGMPGFPPLPFEGKRATGSKKEEVKANTSDAKGITGTWQVDTNAAGQAVTITINFEQNGDKLTGTLSSDVGDGRVTEGTVTGNDVDATLLLSFQGQPLTVMLKGKLKTEAEMSGTLTPEGLGVGDLPFTGVKVKAVPEK